jgi:hypothetical protein
MHTVCTVSTVSTARTMHAENALRAVSTWWRRYLAKEEAFKTREKERQWLEADWARQAYTCTRTRMHARTNARTHARTHTCKDTSK